MSEQAEILTPTRPGLRERLAMTFRALRNRDFRMFWFGQTVSQTGSWMQTIAQAWLVLRLTDSPFALGSVTMLQFMPVLLFGLFGGVVADRFPKRKLLLFTQVGMLIQAAILGVLVWTDLVQLWHIYVLACTLGIFNALDNPARQTLVSELVPTTDLPNAVALNALMFNTSRLLGPALGGVTIAIVGVAGCFFLNAASFVGVVGTLLLIRTSLGAATGRDKRRGAMLHQLREGLAYAWSTPDVLIILMLMAVIGTFGYNNQVVLPLLAEYVLNAEPASFGLLMSAMGVGSVTSAFIMASHAQVSERRILIGAGGFSLLLFSLSFMSSWYTMVPLLVVLGAFSIMFGSSANVRLQLLTPPALRGRILSINTLLFMGTTPIGGAVVGTLAEKQGVQMAVAEMGLICILGVSGALLYRARRNHVAPPEGSAEGGTGLPTEAVAAR